MYENLDVIVANPSGNITIMVLTPVDRKDYPHIAQKLLSTSTLGGEQVAFILPDQPSDIDESNNKSTKVCIKPIESDAGSTTGKTTNATYPAMEMCGLEFCGNASRALALYKASTASPPLDEITVKVSGCDKPLHATIDYDTSSVEMDMPVPTSIKKFTANELSLNKGGTLVSLDGIAHLILQDIPPMKDTFNMLRDYIYENYDPDLPAFGVMFCDTVNQMMTPVVYVKDVDTTYFEGSCASGTVAAAHVLTMERENGEHNFTMQQPGGTLQAKTVKKEDRIEKISLNGLITLSDIIHIN